LVIKTLDLELDLDTRYAWGSGSKAAILKNAGSSAPQPWGGGINNAAAQISVRV
jgi:hypothetical protein